MDEIVTSDMTIKRAKSFQYLGLTLDETLRFNVHVECLGKSLIKYFGILTKSNIESQINWQDNYIMRSYIPGFSME